MTSTLVDEQGRHFRRKLSCRDCDGFVLPFPAYEQAAELIPAGPL